ncbi:MAG: helix-turn-helix transcriptional regulator [Oscillospiraceae bacterium]|nr:helix-turn-helix transcriptional regulator [Oscillospiraceae bacterium]
MDKYELAGVDLDAALLAYFCILPSRKQQRALHCAAAIGASHCRQSQMNKRVGGDYLNYPNIEAERARMGRTKKDIATYLGVNVRSLQNWQAGKSAISSDKLCMLCDLFDCSADYLLGRTDFRDGRSA